MARSHRIPYWDPEDAAAWQAGNRAIARRNLLWFVACDHVAFGIWTLWPVMVLFMPQNVYGFSAADKFLLGATATFVAAALRIPYSLFVGHRALRRPQLDGVFDHGAAIARCWYGFVAG